MRHCKKFDEKNFHLVVIPTLTAYFASFFSGLEDCLVLILGMTLAGIVLLKPSIKFLVVINYFFTYIILLFQAIVIKIKKYN